ncbi:MAG: sterol desaturase family protein [Deltaproteobacteria bacterium]|nr:sterol desaturase family protein [Deltaproteobacteria bacterium]MBW2445303.1 sterol desaturase family protein [Deltaproteobacteria bacterium]
MSIGNVVISLVTKGMKLAVFYWLYRFRVFELGTGVAVFFLALVVEDFVYYWQYRVGHEVRFFWAAHVTHHSSQHYTSRRPCVRPGRAGSRTTSSIGRCRCSVSTRCCC